MGDDRGLVAQLTEVAVGTVMEVGRWIAGQLGHYQEHPHEVRMKSGPSDLLTATDEGAEGQIRRRLRAAAPDIPILGEEGGLDGSPLSRETLAALERVWVVDPLDGTTNFVHSLPNFGISLALLEGGSPALGVFYDPCRDELFLARRGYGATLNGRPIRVDGTARLSESLVASGMPRDPVTGENPNGRRYLQVAERARNVRMLGSAALQLAYVACGRLSAFWELRLFPWDLAAGWLLVEEAGGRVTDLDGGPFALEGWTVVASNSRIHDELVAALAEHRQPAAAVGRPEQGR